MSRVRRRGRGSRTEAVLHGLHDDCRVHHQLPVDRANPCSRVLRLRQGQSARRRVGHDRSTNLRTVSPACSRQYLRSTPGASIWSIRSQSERIASSVTWSRCSGRSSPGVRPRSPIAFMASLRRADSRQLGGSIRRDSHLRPVYQIRVGLVEVSAHVFTAVGWEV